LLVSLHLKEGRKMLRVRKIRIAYRTGLHRGDTLPVQCCARSAHAKRPHPRTKNQTRALELLGMIDFGRFAARARGAGRKRCQRCALPPHSIFARQRFPN
jgi:hypothetical protein